MNAQLATEVATLSDLGWTLHTSTETTASLETRGPFNWWIFLFCLILFPLIGAMIYVIFWLVTSHLEVFLHTEGNSVMASGDTWYVQRQKVNVEAARQFQRRVKEEGFWKAAGPSLFAALITIVIWFALIWLFIEIIEAI
ncbi:MAG TPA: hypothetical protein VFZ12_07040 [Dehalococcoidia bacterium]|nr:hypothetical protein [Dehalococcoidia bacterium]